MLAEFAGLSQSGRDASCRSYRRMRQGHRRRRSAGQAGAEHRPGDRSRLESCVPRARPRCSSSTPADAGLVGLLSKRRNRSRPACPARRSRTSSSGASKPASCSASTAAGFDIVGGAPFAGRPVSTRGRGQLATALRSSVAGTVEAIGHAHRRRRSPPGGGDVGGAAGVGTRDRSSRERCSRCSRGLVRWSSAEPGTACAPGAPPRGAHRPGRPRGAPTSTGRSGSSTIGRTADAPAGVGRGR